ncbi:spore germination protein [Bacillus salitolerans]|uniref:Spore germination protein n=1 Tax=Bacillus salitolerans TaxID=1437434 RepID=A0ABW4LRU7_9BACI
MPSLVGSINITSVGGGTFTVGDVFRISPDDSGFTTSGSGGFNTGDFMVVSNKKSVTNTNDADISDQKTFQINPYI